MISNSVRIYLKCNYEVFYFPFSSHSEIISIPSEEFSLLFFIVQVYWRKIPSSFFCLKNLFLFTFKNIFTVYKSRLASFSFLPAF